LRHTYGSLLVAGAIDPPSTKAAMGHARITTIERYVGPHTDGSMRVAESSLTRW
jgi:integrase